MSSFTCVESEARGSEAVISPLRDISSQRLLLPRNTRRSVTYVEDVLRSMLLDQSDHVYSHFSAAYLKVRTSLCINIFIYFNIYNFVVSCVLYLFYNFLYFFIVVSTCSYFVDD